MQTKKYLCEKSVRRVQTTILTSFCRGSQNFSWRIQIFTCHGPWRFSKLVRWNEFQLKIYIFVLRTQNIAQGHCRATKSLTNKNPLLLGMCYWRGHKNAALFQSWDCLADILKLSLFHMDGYALVTKRHYTNFAGLLSLNLPPFWPSTQGLSSNIFGH